MVKKKNKFVSGLCVFLALVMTLGAGVGVGRLFGEEKIVTITETETVIDYVEVLKENEFSTKIRLIDPSSQYGTNPMVTYTYDEKTHLLSMHFNAGTSYFNAVLDDYDPYNDYYIAMTYPSFNASLEGYTIDLIDPLMASNLWIDNFYAPACSLTFYNLYLTNFFTVSNEKGAALLITASELKDKIEKEYGWSLDEFEQATHFLHYEIDLFALFLRVKGVDFIGDSLESYRNDATYTEEYNNTFLPALKSATLDVSFKFDIVAADKFNLEEFTG